MKVIVTMAEIQRTTDLFLRSMSIIYLFAFSSLYIQIPGLYGDNGILPVRLVARHDVNSLADLLNDRPTLMNILPKLGLDPPTGMDFLCLIGIVVSFVASISKTARNTLTFVTLWACYLSVFQVGQTFLWFQWDTLLLEVGFLTVIVAPISHARLRSTLFQRHDGVTFFLIKWLLFGLMFQSGVVKLTSQCPTWWALTALNYHYESQCIPTPLAWYMHQLPEWFQKLSVVMTYLIEILLPFLFFSPIRHQRILACYSQVFLMVLILLTGNYNFFNILTIVLCISLLDDEWLTSSRNKDEKSRKQLPSFQFWRPVYWSINLLVYGTLVYSIVQYFTLRFSLSPLTVHSHVAFDKNDLVEFLHVAVPITIWLAAAALCCEICRAIAKSVYLEKTLFRKLTNLIGCIFISLVVVRMFSLSLVTYTEVDHRTRDRLPTQFYNWYSSSQGYHLSSSYGLFRSMTGVGGRPEVIVEGSNDMNGGWKEYNFLYKPGDLSRTPPVVAPHQPRLDWQMWFAALGSYQHHPWFLNLVYRLLNNQTEVLELMASNPFEGQPPQYIRARLYHYHYTSAATSTHNQSDQFQANERDWWRRELVNDNYLPIVWNNEPNFVNYLTNQARIYKKYNGSKKKNVLKYLVQFVRSRIGQPNGFKTCLLLLLTSVVIYVLREIVVPFYLSKLS